MIWSRDQRYDPALRRSADEPSKSVNPGHRESKEAFTDLVRNTYRMLLTWKSTISTRMAQPSSAATA